MNSHPNPTNDRPARRACEACGGAEFRRWSAKDGHTFHRCRRCGLIRSDPQPTDAVLAGIYGGQYYDAWGVKTNAEQVWRLKQATFRRHVLGVAALPAGARVLDCGAAFGAFMGVAREMGFEPYGVELAAEAAAEVARRFGPDRIFSGPFEQAAFPGLSDGAFDGVFMCDFIEHVRDPVAVLRKASALLRSGGRLVITTPDGGSWSCRLLGASWPHLKVEHLFYFNRRNLAGLLERLGFTVNRAARAWKVLDLDYIRHQFNTYPRAGVTPAINLLARLAGPRWRATPASFSLGEMLVVGTKR
jgi:2-polyprenyl-3-methyl-5-hydroxy-6-metoxy-1,4-benzoquinol methylase